MAVLALTFVIVGSAFTNKKVTSFINYGYVSSPTDDGTFKYFQVVRLDYPELSYDCITNGTACKISLPDAEVLNGAGTSDDDVVFTDVNEVRTIKIRKTWNSGIFGALVETSKHLQYSVD